MQVEISNKKFSINGNCILMESGGIHRTVVPFPTINPVTEEEVIKIAEASQDMEGSWVRNH